MIFFWIGIFTDVFLSVCLFVVMYFLVSILLNLYISNCQFNCLYDRSYVNLPKHFLNGPTLASFCLFSVFSNTNFTEETVAVSGIRTRIVGVEGEHAGHHHGPSTYSFSSVNETLEW